jgi:hypothetical protein
MKPPANIVKFRLDGFPLDALDQKRMRRLRTTSDRMGVPIPDLIRQILGEMIDALIADAELPNKIVKFPTARAERARAVKQPETSRRSRRSWTVLNF